ncbi:MAG: tetratricopeptide repeat-containing sulfotransferase family protein [Sphingomonadaceae bacterium]
MNSLTDTAHGTDLETQIAKLRAWQRGGDHDTALAHALALVQDYPENRDVLLSAAHSLRHLLRIDEAMAMLDQLAAHHPQFSRLHEERGLCYVARKDASLAIEALLRAVNINPALPMSWRMLEGLYKMTGDATNAATAATHTATLKTLAPEIVTANALFSDGDLGPAEAIIRAYLLRAGDDPEAMRLLAKIGVAHDVLDDAETLFAAMLEIAPDHHRARYEYADCLIRRHKYVAAKTEVDQLIAHDADNLDYRTLQATVAVHLGDHPAAIALYRQMLTVIPGASDIHLWLGHALKTVGDVPAAINAYRAAAAARPDFGDAYWSLANLKTYRFEPAEIDAMRAAEAAPTTLSVDRYHLCFALGKAYEDKRDYAESWVYYERGNALKRAESGYAPAVLETNTAEQIKTCTPAFFASRAGWGDPAADPIFIVGLPRAGSTLIEQILASHSQVEGTQELPDIQAIVHELQGREMDFDTPRYPGVLADLTRGDAAAFGARYLADTRVYRTNKRFFIDKMPNNFRHIGLIHLILPNAKIIDARREPMACCFSNVKQLFAQGQEFAYSFDDIARYYRTYVELMAHWDSVLPGRVLRVQHEDVIDDLDGSVRRILDYCGLAFEPACVEFHKSKRSVRTPSAEQVRQPIFRDGLTQWENYREPLEPLRAALGLGAMQ